MIKRRSSITDRYYNADIKCRFYTDGFRTFYVSIGQVKEKPNYGLLPTSATPIEDYR